MKIGGRWLVLSLLSASLAHAQGSGEKTGAPPAPPSSATFGPDTSEPVPAVPVAPAPAPVEPAPDAASEVAPTAGTPPTEEPRRSGVVAPPHDAPAASAASAPADEEKETTRRGARVHDGFYLRLALGAGYVSASTEQDSSFSGGGLAPDIWIGGSPTPGLAIGVTLNGVSVPDPKIEIRAANPGLGRTVGNFSGTLAYSVFGLAIDYYPMPREGLHFMAGLNYSVINLSADNGTQSKSMSGFGLLGGVGYEWWIGREWSVGPLARLHWASVSDDLDTFSVVSPVILLGFTYH